MPEDLVSEAVRRPLAVRRPCAGLLIHSDQGSQYSATNFKDLVARHKAVQSMSRRGNCYDNAHAESFWSRLKTELLDGGSFRNLSEARLEISHCITYYNAERRHSALGYLAPITSKPNPKLCPNSVRPRCRVPRCGGVAFGPKVRQRLWDRYFTAAPVQLRQYDAVSNVVKKASKR